MNNKRRKELEKSIQKLQEAYNMIQETCSDEELAFECFPENLHQSERGEKMENAISEMGDITYEIDSLADRIQEIINA